MKHIDVFEKWELEGYPPVYSFQRLRFKNGSLVRVYYGDDSWYKPENQGGGVH